jgi:hypothetical protein
MSLFMKMVRLEARVKRVSTLCSRIVQDFKDNPVKDLSVMGEVALAEEILRLLQGIQSC